MNIMSRFGLTTVVVLLLLQLPEFEPFGFGGSSAPLYSKSDKGITLINYSNFESTIINSTYSWMVEFYSSWCGHCIRFAPTFKQLGEHVKGKGHHIDRFTDLYFESGETSFYKNCVKKVPKGPDLALHKSRRNTHGFLSFFEIHLLFNSNFQSWQMCSLPTLDPYVFLNYFQGGNR